MIGGAILLSKLNNNGEKKWVTAVTADGISASLLTAGIINTAEINIMTGADSTFKWDALGLTAYDTEEVSGLVSKVDKKQFVRFDKHGIYGIDNSANIDGSSWSPTSAEDIGNNATFALTWDGLKVSGTNGVVAKIGKSSSTDNIIEVKKNTSDVFAIDSNGNVKVDGEIRAKKLIIEPGATTNVLFDKVELTEYINFEVGNDDTSHNSVLLATAPGRQIRLDYQVKGSTTGKKLTLLH
jgi:hypothetical protein